MIRTDNSGRPTVRIGQTDIARSPTPVEQSRRLWALTAAERREAMRAGRLTMAQCFEWAQRRPHEVPLINGEFAFIAAYMDEYTNPAPPYAQGVGPSAGRDFRARCDARIAAMQEADR